MLALSSTTRARVHKITGSETTLTEEEKHREVFITHKRVEPLSAALSRVQSHFYKRGKNAGRKVTTVRYRNTPALQLRRKGSLPGIGSEIFTPAPLYAGRPNNGFALAKTPRQQMPGRKFIVFVS